ncbi:hypothetical protein FRC08_001262 [Ceratobasidium sp. 394]|nr:hypothetical protein FRC08_001262 [Ceratobasidium sp. 394]
MPRETSFTCSRCARTFSDRKRFKDHKKEHGRLVRGSSSSPEPGPSHQHAPLAEQQRTRNKKKSARSRSAPAEEEKCICLYCIREFDGNGNLAKHLRTRQLCRDAHRAHLTGLRSLTASGSPTPIPPDSPPFGPHGADHLGDLIDLDDLDDRMSSVHGIPGGDDNTLIPPERELVEGVERTPDAEYRVYIERYPVSTVGQPIRQASEEERQPMEYPDVGNLADPESFEIAHVMVDSGMSGGHRERFMRLKRFKKKMPWKRNRELLRDVDKLPKGPAWTVDAMRLTGDSDAYEDADFWSRDTLEVVCQMVADKPLGRTMQWVPQRQYTSRDRKNRRRGEMWTSDLWWDFQGKIKDEHGTIVPYLISSDETRLSTFSGDKKAHPVYLTIGNIPKRIRRRISSRATVLIGYLPVPKLDCIDNEEKRRAAKRALFHSCMERLLAPLVEASKTGVEAVCADSGVRKIYPALAAYIADFPEQCKIACVKRTHCPVCSVAPDARGELTDAALQDHDDILAAMAKHVREGSARFVDLGLFEARPFWATHTLIDLGSLLSPDLLHQLHKGMFKDHLAKWVQSVTSKATMDERYTSMPEHHGVRHFKNGITSVSQWTGRELKEMAKVFLPVASNCDAAVIRAARALLDFTYLAHSSSLTDDDINDMDAALQVFHEDKEAFVRLKAIEAGKFSNIPKLHMMQHYTHLIRWLGTPDGFNTETYERLHIDFAKAGY